MARRFRPPTNPVQITLDGESLTAESGEPLAASLLGNGKLVLARSPKYHRPRGPSCFRAACDGCLARVDGLPNQMTCRVSAKNGAVIESQNHLGPREMDLLRAADWFFPDGMNHHEIFVRVPGAQNVVQAFARRVAGLGRLPEEGADIRPARRRAVDVLVVGGGVAGMAAAVSLIQRGRSVEVVDDAITPLQSALAPLWGGDGLRAFLERVETAKRGGLVLHSGTTAAGIYGDDVLVVGSQGAEILSARDLVLAPGAHDGVLAFEGNDLPGVMSARAAVWLLEWGVLAGDRVVVVAPGGLSEFGRAFQAEVARLDLGVEVTVLGAAPKRVRGNAVVRSVEADEGGRTRKWPADCVLVDVPRAPSFELAGQAGAPMSATENGFSVQTDRQGRIRAGLWAIGEVTGDLFQPERFISRAEEIAP